MNDKRVKGIFVWIWNKSKKEIGNNNCFDLNSFHELNTYSRRRAGIKLSLEAGREPDHLVVRALSHLPPTNLTTPSLTPLTITHQIISQTQLIIITHSRSWALNLPIRQSQPQHRPIRQNHSLSRVHRISRCLHRFERRGLNGEPT